MKLRSLVAWVLLACLCFSMTACRHKEPEKTYEAVDYTTLDFDQYIKLGQYKGVDVKVGALAVDVSSVTEELENMVAAATTFEEYDAPVTDRLTVAGDYVEINFKGYLNGELFSGGSADGVAILLGDNNGFVDWLDDDLYGIMPGTSVETTGVFPESYYYEEFAGQQVTFKIDLISIKGHYTIPTLDDAFIAANTEYETLAAFRAAKESVLIEAAEEEYKMVKMQAMWEAVMENAEILQLPEQQVMFYYTTYRSNAQEYADMYDYTYEEYLAAVGIEDSQFRESAESMAKEELIFYAIVKAEGYSVSDEEYAEGAEKYAEEQQMTVEELESYYGKEYVIDNVLWDKVMYTLSDLANYITVMPGETAESEAETEESAN